MRKDENEETIALRDKKPTTRLCVYDVPW